MRSGRRSPVNERSINICPFYATITHCGRLLRRKITFDSRTGAGREINWAVAVTSVKSSVDSSVHSAVGLYCSVNAVGEHVIANGIYAIITWWLYYVRELGVGGGINICAWNEV